MAHIFDTKTRARAYCQRKNKRARSFHYEYQKYHGGWLVVKRRQ